MTRKEFPVSAATSNQNGQVRLNSVEAKVPLLAIEAANELDELIEGRQAKLESVTRLADVLKQSFPFEVCGTSPAFIDSGTVAVFSQAMDESSCGRSASTVAELVENAMEIVKSLETSKTSSAGKSLERLRDFCIALSSAASAYQESVFEMVPENPLRS